MTDADNGVRWDHYAACKGMDLKLFHNDYEKKPRAARAVDAVCETCMVRNSCFNAGTRGKEYGVWGGFFMDRGRIVEDTSDGTGPNAHKTAEQWDWLEWR